MSLESGVGSDFKDCESVVSGGGCRTYEVAQGKCFEEVCEEAVKAFVPGVDDGLKAAQG